MAPSTRALSRALPFSASTTPLQAATYLLGTALFSISFLVFLNSAVSFVVTDLLGRKRGVGDVAGTLGFVDELVALAACPLWGLASDRLGVRWVAVLGYAVIAVGLAATVQARDVAGLVLARVAFAIGATAAATMVTATLPCLADGYGDGDEKKEQEEEEEQEDGDGEGSGEGNDGISSAERRYNGGGAAEEGEAADAYGDSRGPEDEEGGGISDGSAGSDSRRRRTPPSKASSSSSSSNARHSVAMSLESDATITQERFANARTHSSDESRVDGSGSGSGRWRDDNDDSSSRISSSSSDSSGDRDRRQGGGKKASALAGYVGLFTGCGALSSSSSSPRQGGEEEGEEQEGQQQQPLPYSSLLVSSLRLGATDPNIALGYLGGFVARASTVAISLFVPLYVNAFFISRGFCTGDPHDPSPELKRECRAAYVLAASLGGAAQLCALLAAPVFGYASASAGGGSNNHNNNVPVAVAAAVGVAGYVAFARLASPEFRDVDGRGGSPAVFAVAALLGISQIGAIVCSLGSLGRGVLGGDVEVALPAAPRSSTSASAPTVSSTSAVAGWRRWLFGQNRRRGGAGGQGQGQGEEEALLGGGGRTAAAAGEEGGQRESKRSIVVVRVPRVRLKGSVAGVYSWCGGAAILLLTKLGGWLFDAASPAAPFYMMAAFNAVLLVASVAVDVVVGRRGRRARRRRGGGGGGGRRSSRRRPRR
ncbi:hypothetical protein GGR56DRAFT_261441 [Xylariaceae sp. FL0804]|nr:hypothetical protein GGR56DRAFT_261441 [Xylariaceae sp. FL0804]